MVKVMREQVTRDKNVASLGRWDSWSHVQQIMFAFKPEFSGWMSIECEKRVKQVFAEALARFLFVVRDAYAANEQVGCLKVGFSHVSQSSLDPACVVPLV